MLTNYLAQSVNRGPWVTSYTLNALQQLPADTRFQLPICSLGTSYDQLSELGRYVLPPLYREAMNDDLRDRIVEQILTCFPRFGHTESNRKCVQVVECDDSDPIIPPTGQPPKALSTKVLAFSVDTAVEEHGPHLPLSTDTIQSYGVLRKLDEVFPDIQIGRPVEYGQLTWGLPFGFSVDLTAELLTEYVSNFANAVVETHQAEALYVVDVHGSIVHRQAIVTGLEKSQVERWAFRWLHEPLAEFASARGDQHAGGVETALVEYLNPGLLDERWWPNRMEELAKAQMSFQKAVELTPNLNDFIEYVRHERSNGIIGNILNYRDLDAELMFARMMKMAENDIENLLLGKPQSKTAGQQLW